MVPVYAATNINISIINHKGIDNNFQLIDELHSVELFEPDKDLRLEMNNGIVVVIKLKKDGDSAFFLMGAVYRDQETLISEFSKDPYHLKLNTPYTVHIDDENKQTIDVTITALPLKK